MTSAEDKTTTECAPTIVHLVTGATGLFASEYIYATLTSSSTTHCALLIHAKSQSIAEIRANELISYLFDNEETFKSMRSRISVYCSDITEKHLGLSDENWDALTASVNYIFHAASNTKLSEGEDTLNSVNVMGTVSVLSLAKKCQHLHRMIHVSTAYVSGTKTGTVLPDDLDMQQPVSDAFQLSKRVAEKLVRKHTEDLPIIILRPSTLVGNATLGRTKSYKAFYHPTRMLILGHSVMYPASRGGKIDVVPSDWAARLALKLQTIPDIDGRCFHMTMGTRAYSMSQVKRIIAKGLNKYGVTYAPVHIIPKFLYSWIIGPIISILHPEGRSLNRDFRLLSNYTCIDRTFDNDTLFKVTGEDKHQLPGLESYYDNLCRYAIENKWQKTDSNH